MRALVIGNENDDDPGFIGSRAAHHGFSLARVTREDAATWPSDLDGVDLVIVLGSEWSVYWDRVAEPVARELALLRRAHAQDRPIFGICFGAQALSAALGGSVRRADASEVGWYDVDPTPAGDGLITPGPWFEWHHDTYTVPPGATELARTGVGPQAFEIGRTLAVQFHPEVTEHVIGRWAQGWHGDLEAIGTTPEALWEQTTRNLLTSGPAALALFDAFAERTALTGGPGASDGQRSATSGTTSAPSGASR